MYTVGFKYFVQLDHRMQNAKQVYCKTFSNDHVQVVENNTQHGDCQIVLMEEDRLTEEDQIELENEYQQKNELDKEIVEEVSKAMLAMLF